MSVRADIHLVGDGLTLDEVAGYARGAEEAGLGAVWVAEGFYDSLVLATLAASATSRIPVGTNVTQWVRPPGVLELAASDVDDLSGGRFILGLGTASRAWNEDWHGIAWERPVRRMREYVEALRVLWEAAPTAPVSYRGDLFHIEHYVRLRGPAARRVPIHLGTMRPQMTRLAGEIAEGVNFNIGLSGPFVEARLLPELARGAARAGRPVTEVARGMLVIAAVDDDERAALRRAKHQIAYYAGVTSYCDDTFAFHGAERELAAVKEAFARATPDDGDIRAAFDPVTFPADALVPDELARTIAIAGTPATVRGQLDRYEGVLDFATLTTPTFLLTPAEIRANHDAILVAFAA